MLNKLKSKKGTLQQLEGHKSLLVSFGGVSQGMAVPTFEFFNMLSDVPCDKIFFRDFKQIWYHQGVGKILTDIEVMADWLKNKIESGKYDKVCFIGSSMGGYAALLLGSMVGVDKILAFGPQTFIDKKNRETHEDKRWSENIRALHASSVSDKYFDLKEVLPKCNADVYYASMNRLDRIHAERMKGVVNLIPVKTERHVVVREIHKEGGLKLLIQSCL